MAIGCDVSDHLTYGSQTTTTFLEDDEYVNREPQTYTILILNWNLFVVFTC